ncbi:hypothetical protein O7630_16945 [Micromonospora sp. WMMD718]|uniref:hypothetical protein n=1 Tax=unclassified Micromonospora TaxID=2617518 RepID=UPI00064BD0C7|nr:MULTISPECIES: hypothetical protein [unclassified Micromonospora]MDG4752632.1 hypothetical protein [Micromonospora sp. WMMD718]
MIEFVPADPPTEPEPGTVAVLPEVLVPLYWWRGVPFDRAAQVRMTPLERFVLELAMTTGLAEPDEFFEITDLPGATLLPVAARRLVAAGALTRDDYGYRPLSPGAERAARTQTVYRKRPIALDVVLLPRTGDLLALDPRSSGLREVEQLRLQSAGHAPVPPRLATSTLADELRARLGAGTLAGVDQETTGVPESAVESPVISTNGWCPVYRCRGELRADGDRHRPVLILPGTAKRDPVSLELPGAAGLAEHWLGLLDALHDPAIRARAWDGLLGWTKRIALRMERSGPCRWRCSISGPIARRLTEQGRNLALPLGLAARDDDAVIEVAIDLVGADPTAEALIEVDRRLTAAAEPGADITALPRSSELRDRAWRLGFPGLVYALRETEDFRYV